MTNRASVARRNADGIHFVAALVALLLTSATGAHAGNIYLSGHGIDHHGGQSAYDTKILDYLRGDTCDGTEIASIDYKIAVVGRGAGIWGWSDSTVLAKPGFGPVTYYDTDDLIAGTTSWSSVLANDVLVINSRCDGCNLDSAGVAEINAHAADILARFNSGMDLWVNSGDGNFYNFLPPGFEATGVPYTSPFGSAATAAGVAIGLTQAMTNQYTHTRFATFSSAYTVMEQRATSGLPGGQAVISLAACNVNLRTVVDHLECFKVKDLGPKLTAIVDLDSAQFGLAEGCKVGKAKKFCVPVKKIVVTSDPPVIPFEGQELDDDRVCYKVTCPKIDRVVGVEDQFGTRTLAKLKPFELCTPARKLPPGALTIFKVNDLNGNGMRDAGEPVIPGWVFTLTNAAIGYNQSATTNASGYATFDALPPGQYTVTDVLQPGWIATGPTTLVRTVMGQHVSMMFTNRKPLPSQINVFKYDDLDGDGIHDPGEPGVEGWPITLEGPGGTLSGVTTASGHIDFFPVPFGSYVVEEAARSGWSATGPTFQNVSVLEGTGIAVSFGNRCTCTDVPGSVCGDGVTSPCEECDDGGTANGDGCNECCGNEAGVCGDGVVTAPEECDPPGALTCPSGAACSAGCHCTAPPECDASGPQCNGECHTPGEVCVATLVQQCAIAGTPCVLQVDCPTPGDTCVATTDCSCRGCNGVCEGGTNPGALCVTDAQCPGGVCTVPPCCCFPAGGPQCTTNADCMGDECLCP